MNVLRTDHSSSLPPGVQGTRNVASAFWLAVWSLTLAIGWLLPNHYPPWSTFHFDAWSAITFLLIALFVFARVHANVQWTGLAVLAAAMALVPATQCLFGQVVFAGNAWVSSAYMLGFLLALLTGARWSISGAQAADGLFLAVGIGSVVSVGLQLHQWLGLDRLDIWSMGDGSGRPFANFGQPNQLGTFLIWGLLALAWGHFRAKLGAAVSVFCALVLLFGLSLTGSRTAWLAIAILVIAAWGWRRLWPNPRTAWVVTALGLYFVACVWSGPWLSQVLTGNVLFDAGAINRVSGESRPAIWAMFLDAAWRHPLTGYGWNQVAFAQMAVATDHPDLRVFYSQSHNLFLDFVLWCGIPVGLFVSIVLVAWFLRRLRAVRNAEDAVLVLFVLVVANHALLEFPLHYAYMLLPTGLVMGLLESRLAVQAIVQTGRWVLGCLLVVATILVSLIVRDYARVEPSYQTLRFEWANIKTAPAITPDVLLLTQWREFFQFLRLDPYATASAAELTRMRNVVSTFPSPGFVQRLATALAVNHQPDEAALWLRRMCKVSPENQCKAVAAAWAGQAERNPQVAVVPWPD